jgi:hypothetical protein
MTEIYNTAYAYFSSPVHASPQDLARHLLTDSAGKITHLVLGPTHQESESILRHAMFLVSACVGALGDLFQLDISTKLSSFIQRLNGLVEQSANAPTAEIRL